MILDLFAGPGGWDEGLKALGRTDVVGIDHDEDACQTARAAGHDRLRADVAELDPAQFADVDGLIASPPCDSFSQNGRRGGMADHRGRLMGQVERWAGVLTPRWIACEQVPDARREFESIAVTLRGIGYRAYVGVRTAADFGVPQDRKRAFLVARMDTGSCNVPAGTVRPTSWVSMADALGIPAAWELNTGRDWKPGGDRSTAQRRASTRPAPTIGGAGSQWWWQEGGERIRLVEIAEMGVLQGFCRDYPWQGTRAAQFRQIGDAVPPPVAAAVLAPLLIARRCPA